MAKCKPHGRCKLCWNEKELRNSHYLPKRLYAFVRAAQLKNPNPIMSIDGELKQISDQFRGHVFCAACEDLLNKNGERWVLANVPKDYEAIFPLHIAINRLTPNFAGKGYVVCDVLGKDGFDVQRLVYFGASVFWRGAVHQWKTSTGQSAPNVDLGGYEESLRSFVLGTSTLPDDVVLALDIWPYNKVLQLLYPVLPKHLPECRSYWFYIPGLLYSLYLGKNIPNEVRSRSAADGLVAVDQGAADSLVEFTKNGMKSQLIGSQMDTMFIEIAKARSKALSEPTGGSN